MSFLTSSCDDFSFFPGVGKLWKTFKTSIFYLVSTLGRFSPDIFDERLYYNVSYKDSTEISLKRLIFGATNFKQFLSKAVYF